ncbi:MAG TPA: CocE/NonD family hydrolase [Clostridia bacterium]|nr:CocE/NonD family hydrolase [Clostridia bacterium]
MTDHAPGHDRPASPARHEVTVDWDVRIAARDGVELSANLWRPLPHPDDPPGTRFPAILELIPYGKDSWRRNADVGRGEYFARRGYAFCRVDVRGTGSSGGVALDEYSADETRDGYDVVEWLAARDWCTGAVGMWGISYGGFTSIQTAKLRPPHLRAIVPVMATDDRYLTDVHYIGGCVTASELSQYAVSQVAMNAMPPDPSFRGPGWLDEWRARLEATPPWLVEWLRQQHDGPYWRQGSLAPDYDAIEAAILNIGGWMDSYVDAALRMQARCAAPSRTIVGNWVHSLPADATPGPNVDELHEMVRFFDRWLKGIDDGAPPEPPVVWFERDHAPPEPFPPALPGRWRAAEAFPHPAAESRTWRFAGGTAPLLGRLLPPGEQGAPDPAVERYPHRPTVGTHGSLSWGAGSAPNGLGRDLRPDEALGPTFTSAPLDEPMSILGFPAVVLHLAVSAPVATAVVRLTDVAPDGSSAQVTAGILNLTHRRSHAAPEALERGRVEEVAVTLRPAGYRFEPGHRIRVSVASSAWPVIWPSPYPAEFELHAGPATPSRLVLPVVPPAGGPGDLPVPAFRTSPPDVRDVSRGGSSDRPRWEITDDVIDGSVTVTIHDGGEEVLHDGRRLYAAETLRLTAWEAEPARAVMDADVVYRWWEHEAFVEIRARSVQTSDATGFELTVDLAIDLDGGAFFRRRWEERIPRRLV